jgi:hypothetical protein
MEEAGGGLGPCFPCLVGLHDDAEGKSDGKATFAGTRANDWDAPIADLPHRSQNCGFAPERHHGIDRADRDRSSIGGT